MGLDDNYDDFTQPAKKEEPPVRKSRDSGGAGLQRKETTKTAQRFDYLNVNISDSDKDSQSDDLSKNEFANYMNDDFGDVKGMSSKEDLAPSPEIKKVTPAAPVNLNIGGSKPSLGGSSLAPIGKGPLGGSKPSIGGGSNVFGK